MKTKNSKDISEIKEVRRLSNLFTQRNGRRPRIMIAEPITASLKKDTKIMASIYADLGFDVDISPPFENAKDIVKQAIECDVHILCISTNNKHDYVAAIMEELDYQGNTNIKLILRTDLTEQHNSFLLETGTATIFPKHTTTIGVARSILEVLLAN